MNTKLTLSLDKNVIEDAKRYADDSKTSLSDIVENYFKAIVSKSKQQPPFIKKFIILKKNHHEKNYFLLLRCNVREHHNCICPNLSKRHRNPQ